MNYSKPPLNLDQQVQLLLGRGMAGDAVLMKSRLGAVNYYRLSGYWYPDRNSDNTFKAGTTFESVWLRYVFDRRLRLLVMDAIERIEVAVRTQLSYHHAHTHGPFAYADLPAALPKFDATERDPFLESVRKETDRSREPFVAAFFKKYGGDHRFLPVWMASEIMSFGTLLTFFRGCTRQVKQAVASEFGMPEAVFDSWLLTLNTVRNICAHHGRLWNRENGVKPFLPRLGEYPDWHTPVKIENNRIFAVLTICRYCLSRVAPQSRWADRLKDLLAKHPAIPVNAMGFPPNWEASPIWSAP